MSAVNTASGVKEIANLHVYASGASKAAERASIRTPDGTKVFFISLASGGSGGGITVSAADVFGGTIRDVAAPVTSGPVTVTVTGGVAPYAYSWVWESGDGVAAAVDGTSATTQFIGSLGPGESSTDVFHSAVTDAAGVTANSPTVTVHLQNMGDTL